MILSDYFQMPLFTQALDRYASFAKQQNWGIGHKMQMYQLAEVAFASEASEENKHDAFELIYESLRRGWKIFRGVPQERCWTSEQVFTALRTQCAFPSRSVGVTLQTVTKSDHSARILNCLRPLSAMKPMGEYPHMAVSKFLHFYNPRLFPIYDRKVIWNNVCNGVFKQTYKAFCDTNGYRFWESEAEFNLYYTLWASDHIRHIDTEQMMYFKEWMMSQLEELHRSFAVANELDTYFATAFEFVIIGAACMERENA